jgi:hypothetical protein
LSTKLLEQNPFVLRRCSNLMVYVGGMGRATSDNPEDTDRGADISGVTDRSGDIKWGKEATYSTYQCCVEAICWR